MLHTFSPNKGSRKEKAPYWTDGGMEGRRGEKEGEKSCPSFLPFFSFFCSRHSCTSSPVDNERSTEWTDATLMGVEEFIIVRF